MTTNKFRPLPKPKPKLKAGDVVCVTTPLGGNNEWVGVIAVTHTQPRADMATPWFELLFPVRCWHGMEFHLGSTWYKNIKVLGHINV